MVGVAGIYQLSRFNALMLNYKTAQDAATTATESYGSVLREQEEYNKSLEARLNRLQTAWYGFADAVGSSILYDALVVGTSALETLTNVAESGASGTIALSTSFGILGGAALLLSTRVRTYTTSLVVAGASQVATATSSRVLAGAMTTLATGTGVATTAMRGFLAATGIGLVISGVALAIGTLTSKLSEVKQESEALDAYLEKNTGALTKNKTEVDSLTASLEELRNKRESSTGLNVQEEQEYVNIQNRLAELYPALVDHIDANGNAHIKNKDAIAEEVAVTKELVQAERELARAESGDRFEELTKELSKAKKEAEDFDKAVKAMRERGFDESNIAEVNLQARQAEQAYSNASAEIQSLVLDIAESWIDVGETVNSTITGEVQRALDSLDLSKLSPEQLSEFSKALSDLMVDLSQAFESGDTSGYNKLNKELGNLISNYGLTNGKAKVAIKSISDLNKEAENSQAFAQAAGNVDEYGNSLENLEGSIESTIASYQELKSIEEQLSGVSTKQIEDSYDLITTYELLSNATNRTREHSNLLKQAQESLSAIYPHLVQNGQLQIDSIHKEVESYKVLQEAIKNARDGKLSAEQQQTLATALGVNERIKYLKQEIMAMENAYNSKNRQYQELVNKQKSGAKLTENEIRGLMQLSQVVVSYETKSAELDKYMIDINSSISNLKNINNSVSSSASKSTTSQSNANKETSKSIYVTDQYKLSLEALSTQIDKLAAGRDKFSESSDKYRKSLQEEIKLQQQQLKLMKQQASSLQSQISSGKIKQTGSINVPTTSTTTSSGGQVNVSGFGGRITSGQGYRIHPVTGKNSYHAGIDIAGAKGTRLDSHVNGSVVASGYNDISGNYVKIKDAQGFTHFFGHLEKRLVQLGDAITAGKQIGTIGSTGRSTGSHLHYEVKNASGKYVDAASFVKDVRADGKVKSSGTTTTTKSSGNGTIATGQEAIDQAKSELNQLLSDIASQEQAIRENQERIIDSQLSYFDVRKEVLDTDMNLQDNRLRNIDKSHKDYNKVLDYQLVIYGKKQKYLKQELTYAENLLKSGTLTEAKYEEIYNRVFSIKDQLHQVNAEANSLRVDRVISSYDVIIERTNQLTALEQGRLSLINTSSAEYTKALEGINYGLSRQRSENEALAESLIDLLDKQDLSGEALEKANAELLEARNRISELDAQISRGQFDIIMNIQTNYDETTNDLDFEINRERELRKRYEEGSDAYQQSIQREIAWIEKKIEANRQAYKAQEEQLKVTNLTSNDYKEVTNNLENLELAYWQLANTLEETNETLKESSIKAAEEVAEGFIDALKDYYSQKQDEVNSDYDKELELAEKRHDKVMQQYKDEMDLYRRNAEEKLNLLDRQEAERTYDMEIDDLQTQRQELQNRINRLASATSRDDLKLRRDLQKQLGEVDEQIAETRHQRDLELQKQNINDLLALKEEEISKEEELETERYEEERLGIENLKEYWNQYYTDLLNDERRFNDLKQQIIDGHINEVMAEFEGYALDLESTMFKLENTLEGTMKAVGTSIRQNVIDNLREALSLASSFQSSQQSGSGGTGGLGGSGGSSLITPENNPNAGKPSLGDRYDTVTAMTEGDYKVLLGKYLFGRLTSVAHSESTREALRQKGMQIAAEGRKQGSTISEDATINGALATASLNDLKGIKKYFNENITKYVSASHLLSDVYSFTASLDTGGTIKTSGRGVDGIGGRFAVVHPNETVLTNVQSDRMFETIPMLDKLQQRMSGMIDKFQTIVNPSNGGGQVFGDFIIQGDVINSNGQTADTLYEGLINNMRTKGVNIR